MAGKRRFIEDILIYLLGFDLLPVLALFFQRSRRLFPMPRRRTALTLLTTRRRQKILHNVQMPHTVFRFPRIVFPEIRKNSVSKCQGKILILSSQRPVLMGSDGFWWVLMGSDGFRWVLMGFWWVSMGFDGFWWVSMGFDGFWWVFLRTSRSLPIGREIPEAELFLSHWGPSARYTAVHCSIRRRSHRNLTRHSASATESAPVIRNLKNAQWTCSSSLQPQKKRKKFRLKNFSPERILYCPAVYGHSSSAPVKTDRAVRIQ